MLRLASMVTGLTLVPVLAGCTPAAPTQPQPSRSTIVSPRPTSSARPAMTGQSATILATAEVHGTTEPCGCNSDPLGDLARVASLAPDALLVDAGGLLYDPERQGTRGRAQADAKAKWLAQFYERAEVGLGGADLQFGPAQLAPPRHACNVKGAALSLKTPVVRQVGLIKVGVFGVVAPARLPVRGLVVSDAVTAARAAIRDLEKGGAQVIVGLLQMNRAEARALVTAAPGMTFGIIGADVNEGMAEPEPVGTTWLVAPADQGRRVARLDLFVRGPGKLEPFAGAAAQALAMERAVRKIESLTEQLVAWEKDPQADPKFVAARREELAAAREGRARLVAAPPVAPPSDGKSYFVYALEPIRRVLPRDPTIAASLRQLDAAMGRANLAAAAAEPPPAAEAGKPTYVGREACTKCHRAAAQFWQHTVHASAWKTLVDVGKQYNHDCIGCHVTGLNEPGGAGLATVEKLHLTDVQCEVCHGAGSKHVEEAGMEEPKTMIKRPADGFCEGRCHTREHSDTFQRDAYLRDVLGPGHGEQLRAKLGKGPTGHELRAAALGAAGLAH